MRKLANFKFALVLTLATLVFASSAFAQESGDAGVFWDAGGTQPNGQLPAFVPTNLYVVGFDLAGDVLGYEGSLTVSDPTLLLLVTILSGPGPINVGTPTNFIVGAGGCFSGAGTATLITYQYGNFTGAPLENVLFCMGAATPSSFAPATPGYLTCASGLVPFGVASSGGPSFPNGCAVANNTLDPGNPISTVDSSWGAVKSEF